MERTSIRQVLPVGGYAPYQFHAQLSSLYLLHHFRAVQVKSPDLPRFKHALQELDFVLANVVMALIADFMLVWLPAPTLSYK